MVALGVVILSLGSLIEVLDLTTSAFAAMLVVLIVIEVGGFWPWLVYAATGLLALLLPLKLAAAFYLLFTGYYPIIKEKIEKLGSRVLQWAIKLAILNAALTLAILAGKYIFTAADTEFDFTWMLYPVGNAAFVLFDVALTRLISLYIFKWRKKLRITDLK
jgi:hypothetical protein